MVQYEEKKVKEALQKVEEARQKVVDSKKKVTELETHLQKVKQKKGLMTKVTLLRGKPIPFKNTSPCPEQKLLIIWVRCMHL